MLTETVKMWENTPGMCEEVPVFEVYMPKEKKHSGAMVIFPGGGYHTRAEHEGKQYAEFLNENGICAFVCEYRVFPHEFPLPLVDARRSIRYVRFYAQKYGIDKNKVFVMGSSAGGHLAALTATYRVKTEFEDLDDIDKESALPNGQVLCYPVINLFGKGITHFGSGKHLLGSRIMEEGEALCPHLIADRDTPPAFIWHTFEDASVNVINSIDYAKKLKQMEVDTELHIFPYGHHGLGLANENEHVKIWQELLLRWLKLNDF